MPAMAASPTTMGSATSANSVAGAGDGTVTTACSTATSTAAPSGPIGRSAVSPMNGTSTGTSVPGNTSMSRATVAHAVAVTAIAPTAMVRYMPTGRTGSCG